MVPSPHTPHLSCDNLQTHQLRKGVPGQLILQNRPTAPPGDDPAAAPHCGLSPCSEQPPVAGKNP